MNRKENGCADVQASSPAATGPSKVASFASESAPVKVTLSDEEKTLLLQIARRTLETFLDSGRWPHFRVDTPSLNQQRAVFVTLWRRDNGELRGCRGESTARRPLVDAVVAMSIASAVDDPRFYPVTLDELPKLRIDINALTPLEPIRAEDVVVGRHGLMVVNGGMAGLLLPEVPVRFGWDRQQFLEGTCQKAGLPRDAWRRQSTELYGFESEEWGEDK